MSPIACSISIYPKTFSSQNIGKASRATPPKLLFHLMMVKSGSGGGVQISEGRGEEGLWGTSLPYRQKSTPEYMRYWAC